MPSQIMPKTGRAAGLTSAAPAALDVSGAPQAPAPGPLVPVLLQGAAEWSWRILVIAGAVSALGLLASSLEMALLPLLTAILLTGLLQPVNARLRAARLPRSAAVIITVLLAIALLGGIGMFVSDRAAAQYPELAQQVNALIAKTQHWMVTGPLKMNPTAVAGAGGHLSSVLHGRQGQVLSASLAAGKTLVDVVASVVLTFFLTIFLLFDGRNIFNWVVGMFAPRARQRVVHVGNEMWKTVSGYVSGTFLVALFHGAAMGVTLAVVGVPLVAPLAVLVFIGGFIPVLGVVVFGGLAVLVTLITKGTTVALIVLIALVVQNQVEAHVLQPFVVGRHVSLHPMAIALTLTCGAIIAGLPGAVFAVPLVASLNAMAKALRDTAPPGPAQLSEPGEPEPELPGPVKGDLVQDTASLTGPPSAVPAPRAARAAKRPGDSVAAPAAGTAVVRVRAPRSSAKKATVSASGK